MRGAEVLQGGVVEEEGTGVVVVKLPREHIEPLAALHELEHLICVGAQSAGKRVHNDEGLSDLVVHLNEGALLDQVVQVNGRLGLRRHELAAQLQVGARE